ncbi:hypothetical protein IIA28_18255 [candidate division KSB1 bacterium]|nr:hypothetical protein [candidate division KSB1 bacterium]
MNDIQVGDKVRILDNPDVEGYEPSRSFQRLDVEHLRNQFGIVVHALRSIEDDEETVKLDTARTVIIKRRFLTKVGS